MRPESLNPLFAGVGSLAGVGPTVARRLERLGITRVRDLLVHLPVGWRAVRRVDQLADAAPGDRIAVPLTFLQHQPGHGRAPTRVAAVDAAGQPVALVFFGPQGPLLAARFPVGSSRLVVGTLDAYQGRLQMPHPEEVLEAGAEMAPATPVYRLTEGLTRRQLAGLVAQAIRRLPRLPEWIEPGVLARQGWPPFHEALQRVHAADDAVARDRLAYDELLAGQLAWALVRARRRTRRTRPLVGTGRITGPMLGALPFQLTGAQARAFDEIAADMAQDHAMLRLLQGDVGSGKTLVAALALGVAVEAGVQGAFLAPTELLARQHHASLKALFAATGVRIGFLSGREQGRARAALLAALGAGEIDLLVGTHAIFQPGVAYRNLGLAVIDEQHRFGVAQRLMLQARGRTPPHLLVMTATPIPRTLALARFGEMAVSLLDERPPGRTPVDTRVIAIGRIDEVVESAARVVAAGRQVYWVCPAVDDDGGGDAAAAVARARMLRARFGEQVELVHGRLWAAARERAMARFAAGEARILVATTVIEVGVDVPNATLMVVEEAERFGLAQLHQLRGRVGRGTARSACVLLAGEQLSETARERLAMLRATDDGFAIAEADLRLRGPGELLGTRQAGEPGFLVADEGQVARLIGLADADARLLLGRDGGLEGPRGAAARLLLYLFEKDAAVATLRSG
ncbi:ATP-dependent DNA helicase RecG [Thermaurantiacus sp.]